MLSVRAAECELLLTLAQAFLPPTTAAVREAFRSNLAEDLRGLASETGIDVESTIADFEGSLAALQGETLLVAYSRLFLSPPVKAHLNVAQLLDGSLNGPTRDAIDAAFAEHGVAKREALRDLPDHLSVQLEFLAFLGGEAGTRDAFEDHARRIVTPALARLAAEITASGIPDSPWLHLARIGSAALARFCPGAEARSRRTPFARDPARGLWRHCERCGLPFALEKDVRVMARALGAAGLSAAHLSVCPECRRPV